MSEVTVKNVSKPQMRRLLHSQIKRNLIGVGISVVIAAVCMKLAVSDTNRKAYADFYKTYDINKEFEIMRKKGLFDSCDSDD